MEENIIDIEQEEVIQDTPEQEQEEVIQETPEHEQEEVIQDTPEQEQEEVIQDTPEREQEEVIQETPEQEQEEVIQQTPENEQEEVIQETPEQEKEEEQINEEDNIIDALRRLVNRDSNENETEEEISANDNEQIEGDNSEVQTVETIDYSSQLSDILTEIGITNSDLEEFIDSYTEQIENNNINSPLNSQSCTNVLLLIIIIIMMTKAAIHFIRGIL